MTALPRTPAQSATSRTNGARSHGPTTPEGKARSALNGTRHNLHGAFRLLAHEDPAEHAALLDGYLARHDPADEAERFWVERLVAAAWRLRRLEPLEAATFAAADPTGTAEPDPRLPSLATLARYRARAERDHHHALAELDRLRAERPRLPRAFAFAAGNVRKLRWIADHEERKAAGGTPESGPEAASPADDAPPAPSAEEPDAGAPAPAPAGMTEPEPAAPRLNRHERRRRAALLRLGRLAA